MDDSGQILYKVLSGLGGTDPDIQKNEDLLTPLSQLCRICALPNEYLIPIFEGEGQENSLADKIHSHLPIRVNSSDDYPDHVCYQCASTLLAFHDLVDCCKQANITLSARVQLGQSRKTFTKDANQSKLGDASQNNKERYSLSFRSFNRTLRDTEVPPSPLAADRHYTDVKVEPESLALRHHAPAFPNHNYFIDDALFPSQAFYHDGEDVISNAIQPENPEPDKPECTQLKKQYMSLKSIVAKLQEHVARCHKYTSKLWKNKKRMPRIYDAPTTQELEKVRVTVDGKVQYQCPICDRFFPRTNRYLIHKTVHSSKLYPCEICGRKFRVHGYLKNHLRKIHSLRNSQDVLEYQRSHPKSELVTSKPTDQPKTGRKYFDYKAIDKVKVIINGEVFYQCKICDMKLSRVSYYLNHISVHTGEKRFVCHLCGRRFRLNTMLRVHLRVTHENIKNFSCDVCQQKFGTKNNLIEHRRIHSGERPHICAKCGKRFKQKSALYIHNRTHTDYFPFKCVQCEAKFRIQSQLNYHMIKHTGEKPYSCDVCGRAFPLKCHLNHHMRIHTEVRPYPCTLCGKAFRHTSNLKVHLKNCHKMDYSSLII